MANFLFNNVKGEAKALCQLPAANDALIVVLLEATGVEADDVLNNADDLAALVSGATNEQTNQARKVISASVTITVDDTNNWTDVDVPDQTYSGLAGNAVSDVVFCYDGDTTAGTDSNIRPISQHDFTITPDGSDVTAQIAAAGILRFS
jgi:hypothetical protein